MNAKNKITNHWLLHSNPKYWDSFGELNAVSHGAWSIDENDSKFFSPGDKFILWVSGKTFPGAGIYALGTIESYPTRKKTIYLEHNFLN